MDIECFRTHTRTIDADMNSSKSLKGILNKALDLAQREGVIKIQLRHILLALYESSGHAQFLFNEKLESSRLKEEVLTLREYLRKYYEHGQVTGQSEYFIHQILESAKTGKDLVNNFFTVVSNPRYKTSPENHPIAYLFRYTDETPKVIDSEVGHKVTLAPSPRERRQPFRGWFYFEIREGLLTNAE